jgi:hypothetical protein
MNPVALRVRGRPRITTDSLSRLASGRAMICDPLGNTTEVGSPAAGVTVVVVGIAGATVVVGVVVVGGVVVVVVVGATVVVVVVGASVVVVVVGAVVVVVAGATVVVVVVVGATVVVVVVVVAADPTSYDWVTTSELR